MAGFSDYLEQALLNATLRATAYTSPTKVYLSLHTEARFSHGICPACAAKEFPDLLLHRDEP